MHYGVLCYIAVFVDVFRGNVDASVVPFESVGDGERFESVRFAEWSKNRITGYDIGEVECAALSIVESNLQLIARNVFCMGDF